MTAVGWGQQPLTLCLEKGGHTSFPDESEAHCIEAKPETPTHSSEEAQWGA